MGLSEQHDNSEVLGKVRPTLRSSGRGYAGTGKTLLDLVFPAIPLDTWITAKDVKLVIQETSGKDIALPDSSVSSAMVRLKKEGSIRVRKFSSNMREYQRVNKKKRYVNKALISNKTNKAKILGADPLQAIANSLLVIEGALGALKEEHDKGVFVTHEDYKAEIEELVSALREARARIIIFRGSTDELDFILEKHQGGK